MDPSERIVMVDLDGMLKAQRLHRRDAEKAGLS